MVCCSMPRLELPVCRVLPHPGDSYQRADKRESMKAAGNGAGRRVAPGLFLQDRPPTVAGRSFSPHARGEP